MLRGRAPPASGDSIETTRIRSWNRVLHTTVQPRGGVPESLLDSDLGPVEPTSTRSTSTIDTHTTCGDPFRRTASVRCRVLTGSPREVNRHSARPRRPLPHPARHRCREVTTDQPSPVDAFTSHSVDLPACHPRDSRRQHGNATVHPARARSSGWFHSPAVVSGEPSSGPLTNCDTELDPDEFRCSSSTTISWPLSHTFSEVGQDRCGIHRGNSARARSTCGADPLPRYGRDASDEPGRFSPIPSHRTRLTRLRPGHVNTVLPPGNTRRRPAKHPFLTVASDRFERSLS